MMSYADVFGTSIGVLIGGLVMLVVTLATIYRKRPDLSDLLIAGGGLLVLAGVYLLLGLAVALILFGAAVVFVGVKVG